MPALERDLLGDAEQVVAAVLAAVADLPEPDLGDHHGPLGLLVDHAVVAVPG